MFIGLDVASIMERTGYTYGYIYIYTHVWCNRSM